MDQAQLLHSSLPQNGLSNKAAKSSLADLVWQLFLQFWLEQHTVMTYACNTAYLPSLLSQMGNQLPWQTALQLGSGRLTQASIHAKKQVIFPDMVFRMRFSLCPKAKAIWPQHTTAWNSSGFGRHKDNSEGTRTEPEHPWPHTH